jgi:hypothetical protein
MCPANGRVSSDMWNSSDPAGRARRRGIAALTRRSNVVMRDAPALECRLTLGTSHSDGTSRGAISRRWPARFAAPGTPCREGLATRPPASQLAAGLATRSRPRNSPAAPGPRGRRQWLPWRQGGLGRWRLTRVFRVCCHRCGRTGSRRGDRLDETRWKTTAAAVHRAGWPLMGVDTDVAGARTSTPAIRNRSVH